MRLNSLSAFSARSFIIGSLSENWCDCQNVASPDNNSSQCPSSLAICIFTCLIHLDIEVLVHCYEAALENSLIVFNFYRYLRIYKSEYLFDRRTMLFTIFIYVVL